MPCFMDKLSDGRRLSVKRGELWTKSMTRGSLQKKWLVFLRGWEDWCEIALISQKSGILAKELGFSFARMLIWCLSAKFLNPTSNHRTAILLKNRMLQQRGRYCLHSPHLPLIGYCICMLTYRHIRYIESGSFLRMGHISD